MLLPDIHIALIQLGQPRGLNVPGHNYVLIFLTLLGALVAGVPALLRAAPDAAIWVVSRAHYLRLGQLCAFRVCAGCTRSAFVRAGQILG